MLFDALFAVGVVFYYAVVDMLNVALRGVLPVIFVFTAASPGFLLLASGTVLFGLVAYVTLVLVSIAFGRVMQEANLKRLSSAVSVLYVADGVASVVSFALGLEAYYPGPRTFVGTMMLQIPSPFLINKWSFGKRFESWYVFTAGGFASFVTSRRLAAANLYVGSFVFVAIAVVLVTYAMLPDTLLTALKPWALWLVDQSILVENELRRVWMIVWPIVVNLWPHVKSFVIAAWRLCMYHPIAVLLQDWLIRPLWRTLSPLGVPALTAALSVTLIQTVIANGFSNPVLAACQLYCAAASAVATVILAMHAFSKVARVASFDPLKSNRIAGLVFYSATLIGAPFLTVRWIAARLMSGRIQQFLQYLGDSMGSFAKDRPFATLAVAFFGNLTLLVFSFKTVMGTVITNLFDVVWINCLAALRHVAFQFLLLQSASRAQSAGSVGAVFAIALSQTVVFYLSRRFMRAVWGRVAYVEEAAAREVAAQLAESMRDPRQCGRCGFGPVDYTGCAILTSHHGERYNGASVSNACPRCDWFVSQLDSWPYFSAGRFASEGANAAVRIRVFADVVIAVRAGAKALIVPFLLLRLGSFAPIVAGLAALVYLALWGFSNAKTWVQISDGEAYRGARYPARNADARGNARGRRDDDDCGARPAAPRAVHLNVAQAIEAIEFAAPVKCFLEADGACPVCLDGYEEEAVAAARKGAQELRKLQPSIVALPCGHTLHYECAQRLIQMSHLYRCPLCREPLTVAGSVGARFFH